MLTGGAATEVLSGQQYPRVGVTFIVQYKLCIEWPIGTVHIRLAVVHIAPLIKQVGAEAGSLDRFQKLLGDNGIRIHVGSVQRGHNTGKYLEFVHYDYL